MLSKDWVYENIFKLSGGEQDEQRVSMLDDLKDRYRFRSIEDEGSDPAIEDDEPSDIEEQLEDIKNEIKDKGGRPREGGTYGKDKHPYGRDPLGSKENQKALKKTEGKVGRRANKLAKEYVNGISPKKKVITEKTDFLSDDNLLDDEKFNK